MQNKAVKLSLAAVGFFLLAAVGLAIAMPWLVRWYISWQTGRTAILIAYYACLPFALTALVCLWKLLRNIRAE